MAPAIIDGTTVDVDAGQPSVITSGADAPYRFRATGSVVRFPGFLAVYRDGKDEGEQDELDQSALPELTVGEMLDLLKLLPEQHFTQPPPRFTEATLVKALEEQGIGRPSTYAPTIGTLVARSYVTVDQRKLIPTELGMVVNDLLVEHFPAIFDVGFTSRLEDELDEIAAGDRSWIPTLHEFYGPFTSTLRSAEKSMERVKLKDEPAGEDCEKCGRPMVIKLGRYGKFMACSGFPECRNSRPLLEKIGVNCPQCKEGQIRGAAVEEGSHLLRMRALSRLRLRRLEQAGQPDLPDLRRLHGGSGTEGPDSLPELRAEPGGPSKGGLAANQRFSTTGVQCWSGDRIGSGRVCVDPPSPFPEKVRKNA
jgi:DNA topoisomerase-1